jgi:predicted nucleic acid-binding protein
VAWALPGDARHGAALTALAALRPLERVLTTNHVVGETWTFLRRRDSHRSGVAFLERVATLKDANRLVVQHVKDDQEEAAWALLRRHDERAYSFVDATRFRVMHERRLREALAFDGDFAAVGFIELGH